MDLPKPLAEGVYIAMHGRRDLRTRGFPHRLGPNLWDDARKTDIPITALTLQRANAYRCRSGAFPRNEQTICLYACL
jgi:hypothetical protein